jgi:peptidoglycan/xylan/chitin deacetylase (PgdA/CDA1 family)
MKLVRFFSALGVFVFFLIVSSQPSRLQVGRIQPDAHPVASPAIQPPPPKSISEIALELPDSLLPFCHGGKSSREIALSFDACPTSGRNHFNKTIANTLIQTRTPATIFLSGRWVQEDTAATRLLASDSLIELGNHSFTHPHMTRLPVSEIKRELERTQEIIKNLTGQVPFLFRAPYGELDDTLMSTAKKLGLVTVQFSVESGDPDTSFTAERLIKWVTREARNGSVIIMHINNRGWHTAQALPTIINDLRGKGYKFVKVSKLMKEVIENNRARKDNEEKAIRALPAP